MIVVAAGTGSRFESDKMMAPVDASTPLVARTVARVRSHVDRCVLVCREEHLGSLGELGVELVIGGPTRTASEIAGVAALGDGYDLIGIHDGARPNPSDTLIEALFDAAGRVGGAVPVVDGPPLVDLETLAPVDGVVSAQTPQVFHGPTLVAAYRRAAETGFVGHDTHEVIARFSDIEVAAVPGEDTNIKVTYPSDLAAVLSLGGD
jgi:2-C-methyl-D-erythritol 4-phosphate cytidylyltransferase